MSYVPENTSKRDPYVHLLGAMSEGSEGYITGMEAAGQRQLVASAVLPTKGLQTLVPFGVVVGEKADDLFTNVTLPEGWRKEGSDHAMWSYLVDNHGRRRASVFYKAAFYDRDAFVSTSTVDSYASDVVEDRQPLVFDDSWATPQAVREAIEKRAVRADEEAADADRFAQNHARDARQVDYWTGRATEHRALADKYRTYLATLSASKTN